MAPRPLLIVGVVTLILGLLVPHAVRSWLNSRTTEPVNVPAKIDSGEIQTIEFHVNVPATYWVDISYDRSPNDDYGYCDGQAVPFPSWSVDRLPEWYERHSEPWADSTRGFGRGNRVGWDGFDAPPGKYQLRVTFPKGMECVKKFQPRVVIVTYDVYIYGETADYFSVMLHYLGAVGLACMLWALAIWLRVRFSKDIPLRLFPGIVPRNHLRLVRHRPMPLFTQFPNFGLMYGAVLWILIVVFMILEGQRQCYGLLIELRTRDPIVWQKSPWQETLGVYVTPGNRYYVNGQLVRREDLRARLQQELSRRMVWTVYFEADNDTLNMDAMYAMDTIQGLGAKVVWITPKVREEIQRSDQPTRQQLMNEEKHSRRDTP
jgi:biopolymer transport protein ExbD